MKRNNKNIDWEGMRQAYDSFLAKPDTSTAYELTPFFLISQSTSSRYDPEEEKTLKYFFEYDRFSELEKLIKTCKVEFLGVGFSILKITDGHTAEELSELLGLCIVPHPEQFLQALEANKEIMVDYRVEGVVAGTYSLFVDDPKGARKELQKRYKAIKKTKTSKEMKMKCLNMLKHEIDFLEEAIKTPDDSVEDEPGKVPEFLKIQK